MKIKFAVTYYLIAIICCQNLSAQNIANDKEDKKTSIDSLIEQKMIESGIVGIGAAIIIDKKLVWTKGYGYADKENNIPFTPSTIMNIASISKTFTGFCIMKAVEEGKLSLDEDINIYLPFKVINPNFPNEKISLRHLATHTSSLADRYPFYDDSTYFYGGSKPESLGDFLQNYYVPGGKHYSAENFLNNKPGTYRDYSNIGAGLAGFIVELKTGKKLNEYAELHIFKPLKMTNSGWSLNEINVDSHTKLYSKINGKIEALQLYEGSTYPDGGVRTSIIDLSKFFITLLDDGKYKRTKLLKKELASEMLRFQFTETNKPENVELKELNSGIFWATKNNVTRIGHNGSDPGVRTFMLSDLKREISIIVFFNTSLSEEEGGIFSEVYRDLYKYALDIKKVKTTNR